jgi:hypothetical protein
MGRRKLTNEEKEIRDIVTNSQSQEEENNVEAAEEADLPEWVPWRNFPQVFEAVVRELESHPKHPKNLAMVGGQMPASEDERLAGYIREVENNPLFRIIQEEAELRWCALMLILGRPRRPFLTERANNLVKAWKSGAKAVEENATEIDVIKVIGDLRHDLEETVFNELSNAKLAKEVKSRTGKIVSARQAKRIFARWKYQHPGVNNPVSTEGEATPPPPVPRKSGRPRKNRVRKTK